MADPAYLKGAKGSQLLVKIQTSADGVVPIVYGHPCTINAEREFSLEVNVTESVRIDCNNPDAPAWVERTADTISGQITGGGRLHTPDYGPWWDWAVSGQPKLVQVVTNVAAADGGDVVEGQFLLTTLSKSGARGGETEASVTLQSTGPLDRTEIE